MMLFNTEAVTTLNVVTDCNFLRTGVKALLRNTCNRPVHFLDIDRMEGLYALKRYLTQHVQPEDVIIGVYRNRMLSRYINTLVGLNMNSSIENWQRTFNKACQLHNHQTKWLKLVDHLLLMTVFTKRQKEIVNLIRKGRSVTETAGALNLSEKTVYGYMKELQIMLKSKSVSELYYLIQERL